MEGDPFWEVDRLQQPAVMETNEHPETSSPKTHHEYIPMEEGEIEWDTDQDPSVLEVPVINWAKYVGVKSVQFIKLGPCTQSKRGGTKQLGP